MSSVLVEVDVAPTMNKIDPDLRRGRAHITVIITG